MEDYKAVKIYNIHRDLKERILHDFERKNRGFFFERAVKEDDGIIYIYFMPRIIPSSIEGV